MRTNIVIDDDLMTEALELSGLKTKKEVVEHALHLLIQIKQQEQLRAIRGKVRWTGRDSDDNDSVPAAIP